MYMNDNFRLNLMQLCIIKKGLFSKYQSIQMKTSLNMCKHMLLNCHFKTHIIDS